MKKTTILLILILFIAPLSSLFSMDFKSAESDGVLFQWFIEEDSIHIILSAPTEGWVAVGFNPSRVMKDADFKLAYVDGDEVVMEDHFGTGLFGHKEDTRIDGSNDFEVIKGVESDGETTIEFIMPLNSGDPKDSILVEGEETKVLLAYANTDNMSRKHSWRTSITVEL